MTARGPAPAAVIAVGAVVLWAAVPHGQAPQSVWDGVYTDAQAKRGAVRFDAECASCHGPAGSGGGMAPALVGPAFSANYDQQTVGDLFDRNRATMPPGKEGQMGGAQTAEITAFMLQANGFPAGETELPSQGMALKSIQYLAVKPEAAAGLVPRQGNRPPGTHQDNTEGKDWITRLERPERIPGLKTDDVIARLGLKPGDVVADIGAGTGAFTLAFARAVAPSGAALAVDIWPELLAYTARKAATAGVVNLRTVLARRDDPMLPPGQVDVAFFHDVFHNVNDRQGYLRRLVSQLKPGGRIAIIEQEFDDPIAQKWDHPEDRITREQVQAWMAHAGLHLVGEYDTFQGAKNPAGAGMPERWFVVYAAR